MIEVKIVKCTPAGPEGTVWIAPGAVQTVEPRTADTAILRLSTGQAMVVEGAASALAMSISPRRALLPPLARPAEAPEDEKTAAKAAEKPKGGPKPAA